MFVFLNQSYKPNLGLSRITSQDIYKAIYRWLGVITRGETITWDKSCMKTPTEIAPLGEE